MLRFAVVSLCVGQVFAQSNQSPQDLLQEAVSLQQQGKLEAAIHDYELFLDMYPDAPNVRSNLGAALVGAGYYARAIEQYKRALNGDANPAVRLNLAIAYYKAGQIADALVELEKVHETQPSNVQATMLLADCDLRKGDNKKAIELLTPLYNSTSSDLGVIYMLGMALIRDGQGEKGQRVIDPILSKGDSAEARLLMGMSRFRAREYTTAVVDLAKAAELNPDLPDVHAYYGLALFSTGDMDGSRKAFETELKHDPTNFEANLHLGTMLRQDQSFEQSLTYLQRALNVRPGDLAVRYQIALVELAQGKQEPARDELEAIVKKAPSFTEAHVSLATIYYREKRKEEGDRERALVQKLNAEKQALQPGAKLADGKNPAATSNR